MDDVNHHIKDEGSPTKNIGRWIKKYSTMKLIVTVLFFTTFIYLQLSATISGRKLKDFGCSRWSDLNCGQNLWRGAGLKPNDHHQHQPNDKYQVSVVMSYCNEDINTFMSYIDDRSENISVKSMAIISRCSWLYPHDHLPSNITKMHSYAIFPEMNFFQYLNGKAKTYVEGLTLMSTEDLVEENHMIIFLKEGALQDGRLRKLDDVIHSAKENGFGCVNQAQLMMSYYHDTDELKNFVDPLAEEIKDYSNLGQWVDHVNISSIFDKKIVPVCYGSSFAIHERDLVSKLSRWYPILKLIGGDFGKQSRIVRPFITQYIERTLAAIFSHELPEEKVDSIKKFNPHVIDWFPYNGVLTPNAASMDFYTGDTLGKTQEIDLSTVRLSLVISHCHEDMLWMQSLLEGFEINDVTIYSKCNVAINGYVPPGAKVIELPNYGRCDHSYAHFMTNMKEEDNTDNHYVLFLKASRRIHQGGMTPRSLHDMIRIASHHGFSCELKHAENLLSHYHFTSQVTTYAITHYRRQMIKSPYENMGSWLDNLEIDMPTPIMPVCYGGVFVVKASQIFNKTNELQKIEESLKRGDNIEEGHFAERVWAGLLSYPLTSNETEMLYSVPSIVNPSPGGYVGGLLLD